MLLVLVQLDRNMLYTQTDCQINILSSMVLMWFFMCTSVQNQKYMQEI